MPNILRRPMFKLGGSSSDGVGITSGFRKGYNWGGSEILEQIQANPNMSSGEYVSMATSMLPEILKSMQGAGKMDNYDLAMLISNVAGKGGSISDMVSEATTQVTPFVDRYKKAQASMGPAAFNMLGTMGKLKAASETAGKETATQTRYKAGLANVQLVNKHNTLSELKQKAAKGDKEAVQDYALYELNNRISNEKYMDDATVRANALKFVQDIYKDDKDLLMVTLQDETSDAFKLLKQAEKYIREGNQGLAQGGRVGRNIGGSMQTDMVAENIQTPGGDVEVAAEETMQTPTPGQDPYMLLRARLPQEITDDVVRLIATNPEAFKDFAAIETQEDVIDFNATYGVALVRPAQQV